VYKLEQDNSGHWLISSADDFLVYTLKPEDEAFARKILANLNAGDDLSLAVLSVSA
jgi:hypothetical protein